MPQIFTVSDDAYTDILTKVGWVRQNVEAFHEAHPDSMAAVRIHRRLNALAISVEDGLALPRGTFGGSAGTVHPDSGGTDKGGG